MFQMLFIIDAINKKKSNGILPIWKNAIEKSSFGKVHFGNVLEPSVNVVIIGLQEMSPHKKGLLHRD